MTSLLSMRRLATAVLATAMYDAAGVIEMRSIDKDHITRDRVRGAGVSAEALQREAYAWLTTPSERLEFWAEAAGLDMATVIDGADAAIEYAKRTPRGVSVWRDVRQVRKAKR